MREPHPLTFRVRWSPEDTEWVATCDQFPSLSYLHLGAENALAGILRIVADYLEETTECAHRPTRRLGEGQDGAGGVSPPVGAPRA